MKKLLVFLLLFILIFPFQIITSASDEMPNADIAIVFSHDLHSHIEPFNHNGESVGGFARIKTVIDRTRAKYENTLLLDAGDFSMGTLYQTVFQSSATEYRLLGELGYDAVAFGNHEFDYGFDAVKNMVSAAKEKSTSLPPILCSNINAKESGLSDNELSEINVKEYSIIKKGEYSIAVFGLLGKDSAELSSASDIVFEDSIKAAKDTVSEIKNLYSPDLIICLSHSGTGDDVKDEDVKLAKAIPDIDVIISGHTHTYLSQPIIVGDTIIASCGEYGKDLGTILLNIDDKKTLVSYSLTKIDSSIPEDEHINGIINECNDDIDKYLSQFGYDSADQIIANSPFDFPEQEQMSGTLAEQQLGNLISDSYIHAIKSAEGENYIPVDVSVTPVGVIRASIDKGNITVAQAFEICSLGIGPDGAAGYPLCSVYLYGRELWALAEVDASVSGIMPYAQLYCSGLNYSANSNRMFLNRVYDCWLTGENGERIEIEDNKLYRVVSGMVSAEMLSTVKSKSFGLLDLTPKDINGNEIADFDSHIVIDSNGGEIKEWKALADYLSSFKKNSDGVSVIPQRYASLDNRKNLSDSFSLNQIFAKWNKISWFVFAVILLLIAVAVWIVVSIVKKNRKKKKAALALSKEIDE